MKLAAIALITGLAAPVVCRAEQIRLVCEGVARVSTTESTSVAVDGIHSAQAVTTGSERSAEVLRIEIDAEAGRIKVPRTLRPPISGGGTDGWWPFSSVEVTEREIRLRYSLNILNKPKVLIDRMTGDIDLKGLAQSFSGRCSKADAAERPLF